MRIEDTVTVALNLRPEFVIFGLDADEFGEGELRCHTIASVPAERVLERLRSLVREFERVVAEEADATVMRPDGYAEAGESPVHVADTEAEQAAHGREASPPE